MQTASIYLSHCYLLRTPADTVPNVWPYTLYQWQTIKKRGNKLIRLVGVDFGNQRASSPLNHAVPSLSWLMISWLMWVVNPGPSFQALDR